MYVIPATPAARAATSSPRIKEPAASDRCEDQRHGERCAEHRRAQIARRCRYGATRPECHGLERTTIRAQSQFALCAAVDVIEYHPRKSPFGDTSPIFNTDHTRRLNALAYHVPVIDIEEDES